jgi:transposase-like protein
MAKRRKYSSQMKANILFQAIRKDNASEVAPEYSISVNLLSEWKKQLIENAP